jgi:hypothetical protein
MRRVRYFVVASTLVAMVPCSKSAPACDASLVQAEVIAISNEAAKQAGYALIEFDAPAAEFKMKDCNWWVFYNGKLPIPGNHFFIIVDDGTKRTQVLPGE